MINTVETLKQLRLQQLEDNTTYALLKSLQPNIMATKAYYYYQKYHKKRVFLYYLSKELNVANNLGFRKYVDEQLNN